MPVLIVEKGNERGKSLEIGPGGKVVFGRDPRAHLQTTDTLCSRRHFGIVEKDGRYFVKDLESSNGTFVNDRRITEAALEDGDIIQAGETVVSFVKDEKAAQGKGLVGKMVGGYRVLDRIGRGGMGTVYKANQISLNRIVALKVLAARYSNDKTFVNKFLKEAQAAGRLNHPNIVQVYDIGQEKDIYFFSMEYIEGGTIQDLATKEGRLPPDRALLIITDAAAGLVYAERKQLVHRDIKPDNLMLNADGVVKIADLGLAHDRGELQGVSHGAREGGEGEAIFGTPHFISPEQAQGKPVDTRSDIYSLGATFYRLLAGTTPFGGADIKEILQKQITEEPPPIRSHAAETPQVLVSIVERMMKKDPADRFPTAVALHDALKGAAESMNGGARKAKRPALVFASVVAVLAAAGAIALLRGKHPSPEPAEDRGASRAAATSQPDTRSLEAQARLDKEKREVNATRAWNEAASYENAELPNQGRDLPADDRMRKRAAVAAKYAAVAEAFAGTADGERARERASTLRLSNKTEAADIAREAVEAESKAAAQRARAEALAADVRKAIEAHDYLKAATIVKGREADLVAAGEGDLVKSTLERVESEAKQYAESEKSGASALAKESRFEEAARRIHAAAEMLAPAPADAGTFPAFVSLADDLARVEKDIREAETRKSSADLHHDLALAFQALRAAYAELRQGFAKDDVTQKIEAARAELLTEPYKRRLEDVALGLKLGGELIDTFARELSEGRIKNLNVKLPSQKPAGATFRLRSADKAGLKVTGGSGEIAIPWTRIPAAEIWTQILKDRWEMSQEDVGRAAAFCLEAGLPDEAERLSQALPETGPAGPGHAAALRQEAARETQAQKLITECYGLYDEARSDETAFPRILALTERLVDEFATTRAFLMRSDGSTPFARPSN